MMHRRPLKNQSEYSHFVAFWSSIIAYATTIATDAPDVVQFIILLTTITLLIIVVMKEIENFIIIKSKRKIDEKNTDDSCNQKEKIFYTHYSNLIDNAPYMSTATVHILVQGLLIHDKQINSTEFVDDPLSKGNGYQSYTIAPPNADNIITFHQPNPEKKK